MSKANAVKIGSANERERERVKILPQVEVFL